MFLYLSKKIAIPNNTKINCLEWNSSQDCIAVGGDDGLLKVLKIDSGTSADGKPKGLAGQANLSINKTLEGHSGNVLTIVWNEKHNKLTSSDENGLIIVWTLYKGTWQEEMINNRNKSIVKGMAWNGNGEKICIVYEDGAVIVGSVEGSRIWGKELKKTTLTGVQWSPNSKFLLFTIKTGEVHLYDCDGNFMSKLSVTCLPASLNNVQISACHWLKMDLNDGPQLAIAYKSGHVQLMKDQYDMSPVVFECDMSIVAIKWNHNGSVLALVGSLIIDGDIKESNVLQLYSPFGEHLRTLRIPGFMVSACCWESTSLRITLAIDSFVYFANVRYDYPWCYFADTIVYAYRNHEESVTDITFWNIKKNEFYHTKFGSLLCMDAYKDHCVLAVQNNNDQSKPYSLIISNNINTIVDSKHINFEPIWIAMNGTHVIASSHTNFMTWQYSVPKSHSAASITNFKRKKVKIFHIDDTPSGVDELTQESLEFKSSSFQKETKDRITCITASDQYLLIGRESCALQKYSLPQVALIERKMLPSKPYKLALNSNSKRLAVIDSTGVLSLIEISEDSIVKESAISEASRAFQRRDVWTMKWASDDPELLAIMEKTRMYIIRGFNPEEPISTSAYIASFERLEIQAVMLDDIIQSPENPSLDFIITLETKSLRDTRQLLEKVSIGEAIKFINDNPHPRLSRLLAEASLQSLDLVTSETAFVQCQDYHGIQLVKRLANIHDDLLKQAEVAVYFKDYLKAEKLYIEADRKDLAVILHQKLGNWFKVIEHLKSSSSLVGISGLTMNLAWQGIGDHFLDNQQWDFAVEYYKKADNPEKLVECYIMLKDYESLASLSKSLPGNHPLLETISVFFLNSGIADDKLLDKNFSKQILTNIDVDTSTLNKHIKSLNESNRDQWLENVNGVLTMVSTYINGERYIEAAQLVFATVYQEIKSDVQPNVIKQLAIVGALLIEEYKEKNIQSTSLDYKIAINDFEATPFKSRAEMIENNWRIVESLHFLMLAQRQLYNGDFHSALWTSLTLRNYEDLLSIEQVYSIIALAAIANNCFNIASRAFIKLESIDTKKNYNQLSMVIFIKFPPKDATPLSIQCYSCSNDFPAWSLKCPKCKTKPEASIVSGQPLTDIKSIWSCRRCKRNATTMDMKPLNYCSLCRKENFRTHCDATGIQTPSNLNLNSCTCDKTE